MEQPPIIYDKKESKRLGRPILNIIPLTRDFSSNYPRGFQIPPRILQGLFKVMVFFIFVPTYFSMNSSLDYSVKYVSCNSVYC